MINLWQQRKMMILPLAFAILFSLSRVLTIAMRFSTIGAMPLSIYRPALQRSIRVKKRVIHKGHAARAQLKRKVEAVVKELNWTHLNSTLHEYNVVFAGQAICGLQPCPAELDIRLSSTRNENIHRTIHTMEDGNFWLQIPVTELADEHVDWKIAAKQADGQTFESHGRSILSEDQLVSIDTPISFR